MASGITSTTAGHVITKEIGLASTGIPLSSVLLYSTIALGMICLVGLAFKYFIYNKSSTQTSKKDSKPLPLEKQVQKTLEPFGFSYVKGEIKLVNAEKFKNLNNDNNRAQLRNFIEILRNEGKQKEAVAIFNALDQENQKLNYAIFGKTWHEWFKEAAHGTQVSSQEKQLNQALKEYGFLYYDKGKVGLRDPQAFQKLKGNDTKLGQLKNFLEDLCQQGHQIKAVEILNAIDQENKNLGFSFFGKTWLEKLREATIPLEQKIQKLAKESFIWFYKKEENRTTAFLGNFHLCDISDGKGRTFKCAEAFFQSRKFKDSNIIDQFTQVHGDEAFKLAKKFTKNWTQQQTDAWKKENLQVMEEVLLEKFTQHKDLGKLLLATGKTYLIEHIPVKGRDAFYGDDNDGTGQNKLGELLMKTRAKLGGHGIVSKPHHYNGIAASLRC